MRDEIISYTSPVFSFDYFLIEDFDRSPYWPQLYHFSLLNPSTSSLMTRHFYPRKKRVIQPLTLLLQISRDSKDIHMIFKVTCLKYEFK